MPTELEKLKMGMRGPAASDYVQIFRRWLKLDHTKLTQPEQAESLGIGLTLLKSLIRMWKVSGIVSVQMAKPDRYQGRWTMSVKSLPGCRSYLKAKIQQNPDKSEFPVRSEFSDATTQQNPDKSEFPPRAVGVSSEVGVSAQSGRSLPTNKIQTNPSEVGVSQNASRVARVIGQTPRTPIENERLPNCGSFRKKNQAQAEAAPVPDSTERRSTAAERKRVSRTVHNPGMITNTVHNVPASEGGGTRMTLDSGEKVDAFWITNHVFQLSPGDVKRILDTPRYGRLKSAMFVAFADAMSKAYMAAWSEGTGRPASKFMQLNSSSVKEHTRMAVKNWLACWIDQGISQEEFIHRANESKPRTVQFIQLSHLAGAAGAAVRDWVHPKDRGNQNMDCAAWTDESGQQWVKVDGEPIRVF